MPDQPAREPLNGLGFDVEHWYAASLLRDDVREPVDRVAESVAIVLDLLDAHDVRATFFVVGRVAEEHPGLIRRIADDGHEIGSHSYRHEPLTEHSRSSFASALARSHAAIEDAAGIAPRGFRAPNFSITGETAWAFEVLADSEFAYDSSVFPVRTPMYGVSGAPTRPYVVDPAAPFERRHTPPSADGIAECPLSVAHPLVRAPIAGGFYARALPDVALERAIGWNNRRGRPVNLYFHPWEFNEAVRTDEPSWLARLISFYGIEGLTDTLDRLLSAFRFGPVERVIDAELPGQPPVSTDADDAAAERAFVSEES
ncbi:MAG: polysaccharide deacetylase family protein [Haloarculaceae archaeon]